MYDICGNGKHLTAQKQSNNIVELPPFSGVSSNDLFGWSLKLIMPEHFQKLPGLILQSGEVLLQVLPDIFFPVPNFVKSKH